jgi:hypothetical protein
MPLGLLVSIAELFTVAPQFVRSDGGLDNSPPVSRWVSVLGILALCVSRVGASPSFAPKFKGHIRRSRFLSPVYNGATAWRMKYKSNPALRVLKRETVRGTSLEFAPGLGHDRNASARSEGIVLRMDCCWRTVEAPYIDAGQDSQSDN